MKGVRTSAKLIRAMEMKRAVVFTLLSLAFVSQAFAVLRPPFPAKPAAPFDGELNIIGDDLVPDSAKTPSGSPKSERSRAREPRETGQPFAVAAVCDRRVYLRRLSH